MKAAYIGLDVGTSGCKAAAVDEKGTILALSRREYGFESPEPGTVELNPETVRRAVFEVLKELAAAGLDYRMLSVSSIGEAAVMTDQEDKPLRNGITYLDQRGKETCDEILNQIDGKHLYRLTGVPLNPMYTLNRHLWLQKHQPELVERTAHYFLFGDYITYILTGEKVIDQSSASRTMLFDVRKNDWSEEIGKKFKVPVDKFSRVEQTGTVVGTLCRKAAEETGLPQRLKVVLGCHDQCSALLGAGAVSPGDAMAGEGSTESINLIVDKKDFGSALYEKQLCFEPFVRPGQFLIPVGQLAHGTSIRWFLENVGADFGIGDGDVYERAGAGCAPEAGNVYFLPYLSRVKSMDASNRALGAFLGLEVGVGKAQMYRAVLEGLCFESRRSMDVLKQAGFPVKKITASGGCSKSSLFMQMKADVLEETIWILENPDAGVKGLAMICCIADGIFRDYEEASAVFVKTTGKYEPKKDYQKRYQTYCVMSEAMKALYQNV